MEIKKTGGSMSSLYIRSISKKKASENETPYRKVMLHGKHDHSGMSPKLRWNKKHGIREKSKKNSRLLKWMY